jgi:putative transposase
VPRTARVVAVGVPHHVTQRGNYRQQVFFSDAQRRLYLALLGEQAERHRLRILGYCLMPNHVHFIVVPEAETSMARGFGRTHSAYSRYLNALRGRSGHLWQNRFRSAPLGRDHLIRALRYVDLNPLRARLIERAESYRWSSAAAHVSGADRFGLIDQPSWRDVVPLDDWAEVLAVSPPAEPSWQRRLRAATYSGKPLGSNEFVADLERRFGLSLELRGPGRPRKNPQQPAGPRGRQAF